MKKIDFGIKEYIKNQKKWKIIVLGLICLIVIICSCLTGVLIGMSPSEPTDNITDKKSQPSAYSTEIATLSPEITSTSKMTLIPTLTNSPAILPTPTISPNLCTRESTLLWRIIANTSISRLSNDLEEWANPNTSINTLLDRANDMYSKARGISHVPLCLRVANDNLLDVLYNYKRACKSLSKGDIIEANEDIHFMNLYLEDYIREIGRLQIQYNWEDEKVNSWNGISVGMCEDEVYEILPENEFVSDYEELGRNLYGLGLIFKWLYPEVHLVFSNTDESHALCSPFHSLSEIFLLDN